MAKLISGTHGRDVYPEVVNYVRTYGRREQSRNGVVHDIDHLTIHLETPRNALPLGCGRRLNTRIAVAEALQLIGAFSDPEIMIREFPAFKRYAELKPLHFWGAYGNRISTQLADVVSKLTADPTTRQAVITLWDQDQDNIPGKSDYPCTIALGFRQRGTHLNMNVTMRSNDVWLGLPYDLFQFTQLQLSLCHVLDLTPGTYTHTAWSMHLYEENLDESYRVADVPWGLAVPPADGIGTPRNPDYDPLTHVTDLTHTARFIWDVAFGVKPSLDYAFTESERWYLDALTPSKGKNGEV